ncbi:autotransporter outer membrane beta-barrel domain-containing protein [Termitidicoccus mucosus]
MNIPNPRRAWIFIAALLPAMQPAPVTADEYTFSTGSSAAGLSGLLAGGDTVAISGSAGMLVLSDSRSLDVSNWAAQTDSFDLGTKSGIVFKPASGASDQWAVLQRGSGNVRLITIAPTASGTTVLELNKVVIANGSSGGANNGGGILVSAGSDLFLLKGDVVFYNNTGRNGGGMAALGSVTFAGDVTFDSNTVNAAAGYGGGFTTTGNMASAGAATIAFEKTAVFINNASGATAAGGGMYVHRGHLLVFKDTATFKGNKAGSSGGGIYAPSAAGFPGTITFAGDVLFDSNSGTNSAVIHGGGIYAGDLIDVLFTGAGRVATFDNNSIIVSATVAPTGGGIRAQSVVFSGGTFNITNNAAGAAGTGAQGGGVRTVKALDVSGNYNFSGNEITGAGGAAYVGGTAFFAGSGSFANNKALTNGGALYIAGDALDISGAAAFDGNVAGGLGGAIYAANAVSLTLSATSGDIVFQNNTQSATLNHADFASTKKMMIANAGSSNAIYFAAAANTMNIHAEAGYTVRFSDAISGTAGLALVVNKSGGGNVSFAHNLDAVVTTTVSAGGMILQNGAIYGSGTDGGAFALAAGAGLYGNGKVLAQTVSIGAGASLGVSDGGRLLIESGVAPTVGGGLILAGSGTISVAGVGAFDAAEVRAGGGGTAETLTIDGDLTLTDAKLTVSLHDNDADKLMVKGNAIVSGSKTIDILSLAGSGTYNIGNVKDFYGPDTLVLIGGELQSAGARQRAEAGSDGVNLQIIASADISRILYWTGGTSATWSTAQQNWTDDASVNEFAGGDRVVFDGAHDSAHTDRREISLGGSGVRVSDMIVRGGGTYAFSGDGGITASADYAVKITGSTNIDDARGKLIKEGDGVLRFENSGSNTFRGGIEIQGGAVVFNRAEQLGDGGNGISFTGSGTLRAAGDGLSLPNAVTIGAGNSATLDTQNNKVTVSGSLAGEGNLVKTGAGTLVLAGGNAHTGVKIIQQGTLQGAAQNLGSRIQNEATLLFDQGGAGEFSGEITGAGTIIKKGAGALLVSGSVTASSFRVDEGMIAIGDTTLAATTGFSVNAGGGLTGTGILRTPLLSNSGIIKGRKAAEGAGGEHGRLTIEGNYTGNGGAVMLDVAWQGDGAAAADQLYITGSASGSTSLVLAISGTSGLPSDNATLVHADGGFSNGEGTFVLAERYVLPNGKDAILEYAADGDLRIASTFSPEAAAITGADAAGFLIGKAAVDSLDGRLLALRMNNQAAHRYDLWMAGMHRHDKITSTTYDGTKSNIQGAQVGVDTFFGEDSRSLVFGVFYDYAKSDMHQLRNIASARTESNGGGLYAMYKHGAFYIDGIMRGSREAYEVSVPGTPSFGMDGDSWAGSVAIGYVIEGDLGWNADPEVQLTYQSHRIEDATDMWGRIYHTDSTESLNGRAGVRLWTQREWKKGLGIVPWLRGGYEYEFKGEGRMTVGGEPFENSLSGGGFMLDAGVSMQLGHGFSIDGSGAWFYGAKLGGYSASLGCRYAW